MDPQPSDLGGVGLSSFTVLWAHLRHVRRPRAFHVLIKDSTVDVAGEETKGFAGLVVRHTPMLFVIARVSSCACALCA